MQAEKIRLACLAAALCAGAMAGTFAAPAADKAQKTQPFSVWDGPRVQFRHVQLREQLKQAVRRGDIPTMERVARAGTALMPTDPNWRYNLACALAWREKPDAALAELDKAIDLGFHKADTIANDSDFRRINDLPRFKELVEKARRLEGVPGEGQIVTSPAFAPYGSWLTLNVTNVVWNYEKGVFEAFVRFVGDASDGGNAGDAYLNRDRGHAMVYMDKAVLISGIRYPPDAVKAGVDQDLPNMIFHGCNVFGNASQARLAGPLWRSLPRAAMTDPGAPSRLALIYENNQFWVFPAHKDFGDPALGDLLPAANPAYMASVGSSWSDTPFLDVAIRAAAAFPRRTKKTIVQRQLMGPTMQWLFRRTRPGVSSQADYLSYKAHPTAFDHKRDIDSAALIARAAALEPANVPPAVSLAMVNSSLFPIPVPRPGRDYADVLTEYLYATPFSVAVVLRDTAAERTFLVQAKTFPAADPAAEFTWRVVHGDESKVKFSQALGEKIVTPEKGLVQITVDRRGLKGRIDVACFAKTHGTEYGAPSFISFSAIPLERREYAADGRILSIDYSNPDGVYSDPVIALPRAWKDIYRYGDKGEPLGFDRYYGSEKTAEFLSPSVRIASRDEAGAPKTVVDVRYLARRSGDPANPAELTFVDVGEPRAAGGGR